MKITPDCGAVTMVKPLLLVAVLANIFFLVSSTGLYNSVLFVKSRHIKDVQDLMDVQEE